MSFTRSQGRSGDCQVSVLLFFWMRMQLSGSTCAQHVRRPWVPSSALAQIKRGPNSQIKPLQKACSEELCSPLSSCRPVSLALQTPSSRRRSPIAQHSRGSAGRSQNWSYSVRTCLKTKQFFFCASPQPCASSCYHVLFLKTLPRGQGSPSPPLVGSQAFLCGL